MKAVKSHIRSLHQKSSAIIRDLRIGICNLIEWFSVVWRDRDWDKHFIMEILIFKLKRNRKYMIDKGHIENKKQIATITECIELLEKVQNEWENYEEPNLKKHYEKWGEPEFYFVNVEDRPDVVQLKDRNLEKYSEEQIREKNHEYMISKRITHHKRMRDFETAMSMFKENFDSWWD